MRKEYVTHHKRLHKLYGLVQPSLVPETEDICLTPPHHIALSPWSAINPKFYNRSTHEDTNDSHTDSPQYALCQTIMRTLFSQFILNTLLHQTSRNKILCQTLSQSVKIMRLWRKLRKYLMSGQTILRLSVSRILPLQSSYSKDLALLRDQLPPHQHYRFTRAASFCNRPSW